MNLELSSDDARFLHDHLEDHIAHVESELIHTDKRDLQRALARDIEHLRTIERKLAALVIQ
jgi:hypothetical protein